MSTSGAVKLRQYSRPHFDAHQRCAGDDADFPQQPYVLYTVSGFITSVTTISSNYFGLATRGLSVYGVYPPVGPNAPSEPPSVTVIRYSDVKGMYDESECTPMLCVSGCRMRCPCVGLHVLCLHVWFGKAVYGTVCPRCNYARVSFVACCAGLDWRGDTVVERYPILNESCVYPVSCGGNSSVGALLVGVLRLEYAWPIHHLDPNVDQNVLELHTCQRLVLNTVYDLSSGPVVNVLHSYVCTAFCALCDENVWTFVSFRLDIVGQCGTDKESVLLVSATTGQALIIALAMIYEVFAWRELLAQVRCERNFYLACLF